MCAFVNPIFRQCYLEKEVADEALPVFRGSCYAAESLRHY